MYVYIAFFLILVSGPTILADQASWEASYRKIDRAGDLNVQVTSLLADLTNDRHIDAEFFERGIRLLIDVLRCYLGCRNPLCYKLATLTSVQDRYGNWLAEDYLKRDSDALIRLAHYSWMLRPEVLTYDLIQGQDNFYNAVGLFNSTVESVIDADALVFFVVRLIKAEQVLTDYHNENVAFLLRGTAAGVFQALVNHGHLQVASFQARRSLLNALQARDRELFKAVSTHLNSQLTRQFDLNRKINDLRSLHLAPLTQWRNFETDPDLKTHLLLRTDLLTLTLNSAEGVLRASAEDRVDLRTTPSNQSSTEPLPLSARFVGVSTDSEIYEYIHAYFYSQAASVPLKTSAAFLIMILAKEGGTSLVDAQNFLISLLDPTALATLADSEFESRLQIFLRLLSAHAYLRSSTDEQINLASPRFVPVLTKLFAVLSQTEIWTRLDPKLHDQVIRATWLHIANLWGDLNIETSRVGANVSDLALTNDAAQVLDGERQFLRVVEAMPTPKSAVFEPITLIHESSCAMAMYLSEPKNLRTAW